MNVKPNRARGEGPKKPRKVRAAEHNTSRKQADGHPCHVLARRLLRHQEEMIQFVVVSGLPADNHPRRAACAPWSLCARSAGAHAPRLAPVHV